MIDSLAASIAPWMSASRRVDSSDLRSSRSARTVFTSMLSSDRRSTSAGGGSVVEQASGIRPTRLCEMPSWSAIDGRSADQPRQLTGLLEPVDAAVQAVVDRLREAAFVGAGLPRELGAVLFGRQREQQAFAGHAQLAGGIVEAGEDDRLRRGPRGRPVPVRPRSWQGSAGRWGTKSAPPLASWTPSSPALRKSATAMRAMPRRAHAGVASSRRNRAGRIASSASAAAARNAARNARVAARSSWSSRRTSSALACAACSLRQLGPLERDVEVGDAAGLRVELRR